MQFFTHIAFFAAAQGVFLSLVLFLIRRGNREANLFLGVFVLIYSLWLAEFAAYFTSYLFAVPHLLFVTVGLPLLFGPLLYFYAQTLEGQRPWRKPAISLHFLPFILHTLYYIPFFIQTAAVKAADLEALRNTIAPPDFSMGFYINESLKFLQLILYLGWVTRQYSPWGRQERKRLPAMYNKWLQQLLLGLAFFAFFDLSHLLSLSLFEYDYLFTIAKGVLLSGAFIIYYIGYSTLRQPEIIAGDLAMPRPKNRYEKSSLTQQQADEHLGLLLAKMEEEKYYLNEDLKLKNLSDALGLSTHHFSQLLNEHLGRNFADFVNAYRVKAAQNMLSDASYHQFTILSIAFEAGFKNKASFNAAFKKHSGQTPSQYKKQYMAPKG